MANVQDSHAPTPAPVNSGSQVGRRALLGATLAAAGLCAAGAAASPVLIPAAEDRLRQAALDAMLGELAQLEGVPLDAAIRAAELTRAAVRVIVLPVARLVALLGSGALTVLIGALSAAHNALAFVRADTAGIDALRDTVASWQAGVSALPISLEAYLNADITSAEAYLKALKRLMETHHSWPAVP